MSVAEVTRRIQRRARALISGIHLLTSVATPPGSCRGDEAEPAVNVAEVTRRIPAIEPARNPRHTNQSLRVLTSSLDD